MVESEALLTHLEGLATKHFGVDALRPQQRDVFVSLMQHRQVLAMLPTGAGKTLLYALGSLLFKDSVTVVICPLIALMRDQCRRMSEAGIATVAIYSDQEEAERRRSYSAVYQGQAKLLLVSPERYCLPAFQKFLRRLKIGMVVVDEAHCVVTWGHSFRPEYSQLANLFRSSNAQKILALTATASRPSRELVKEMVFPEPETVFEVIDKPLRDNIEIESIRVFSEDERWLTVMGLVKTTQSRKSILYFPRREQCQKAAQELRAQGFNAVIYHAGLQRDFRRSVEEYLRESDRPVVICATLAFGMGIDLPNVQLIVVVGFPGNLEEMFQMMGRAGRKGEHAKAVLVWTGSDPKKRAFQFDKTMPEVHILKERFKQISSLFPGENQSWILEREKVRKLIRPLLKSERDLESAVQSLAAVASMLGQGGSVDSYRSDWVNVIIERPQILVRLLADLPSGPSRRRLVLEWIQLFTKGEPPPGCSWRMCFSLNEISEDIQLSEVGVLEVLRYYSEKKILDLRILTAAEADDSLRLNGRLEEVYSSLPRYQKWRTALQSSLQALSHFVTAEKCRMSHAESLFLPRSGATTRARMAQCGRCDLCLSRKVRESEIGSGKIASTLTLRSPESLR
ncbi:MAG: RecQ family ATP-dependent DNA helicase [Silvanigrellaceae bacterium]